MELRDIRGADIAGICRARAPFLRPSLATIWPRRKLRVQQDRFREGLDPASNKLPPRGLDLEELEQDLAGIFQSVALSNVVFVRFGSWFARFLRGQPADQRCSTRML